jgi:protein O-mannosyl-transferase
LQVESVAWIAERKNLLYSFFYLFALISYLYYLKDTLQPQPKSQPISKYYYLCLVLFFLSLLSKSMAITLPLVLLLLDYYHTDKIKLSAVIPKIPFFILSIIFGAIALLGGYLAKIFYDEGSLSLLDKLKGVSFDIVFYLSKLFLPLKLCALYPLTPIKSSHPLYLLSVLVCIILISLILASRQYTKKVLLGAGLFFLMVFPAVRFLPTQEMIMAERYLYLACIGIFLLFAQTCFWLFNKSLHLAKTLLILALIAVIICLGSLTRERCKTWQDSLSLWNNVLEQYPGIIAAHINRGKYFLNTKQFSLAEEDFKQAAQLGLGTCHSYNDQKYCDIFLIIAYIDQAIAENALGKKSEAIETLKTAIRFNSDYERALVELARVYESMGDTANAIAWYKNAIQLAPDYAFAHESLSALYASQGRQKEAIQELQQALAINPQQLTGYIQLATMYQDLNDVPRLEALYQQALANNLEFYSAYNYLANLAFDRHQEQKAIRLYKRALAIKPDSKESLLGLGNAYLTLGQTKTAVSWFLKALKLDPALAVAHNNLALAYYYQKQYPLALKHSDEAIRLGYPVSADLKNLLSAYKK